MITARITDVEIQQAAQKLPTAPRLLIELGTLLADPRVESDDVVTLLRQDPALVAQLIRMANSAAYAPVEPVGSLERAIIAVGFSEVHRLVGAVANSQLSDQTMRLYPIDGAKLRQNSLFVAVLMEELAKWAGESPGRCYTVGLLRTIGIMGLSRLELPDSGIPIFSESGETALDVWEEKHWGVSNVEVAEKILLHWRFPHETVKAIRWHYHPGNRHNPIIHLLKLAASASADRFSCIPGEEGYWDIEPDNFTKAGLTHLEFQMACKKAHLKFERLRAASA